MLSDITGPRSHGADSQSTKATSVADPRQRLGNSAGADGQGKSRPQHEQQTVRLSSDAQTLKSLEASVMASSDIDNSKVASIRASVEDGSYQVNAERLAHKMMDFESLLD